MLFLTVYQIRCNIANAYGQLAKGLILCAAVSLRGLVHLKKHHTKPDEVIQSYHTMHGEMQRKIEAQN